jgi:glutamate-1-semialdehyde 2,1-aminomutase
VDVAAVLIEPALTNIGIVLPEPGYLEGVRELTRRHGSLLIHDETHTFSAGPGGVTGRDGLQPDIVTIGKSIAGGVPCGAYGLSAELAERALSRTDLDLVDMGGVGGTLAGNPVSMAAARACLGEVLTEAAFAHMEALTSRLTLGLRKTIQGYGLAWSVAQLGARVEYRFADPAPRTGTESAAAHDDGLDDYLHVAMANRGVLLTPFHNMALTCPDTTESDVDTYLSAFDEVVGRLVA